MSTALCLMDNLSLSVIAHYVMSLNKDHYPNFSPIISIKCNEVLVACDILFLTNQRKGLSILFRNCSITQSAIISCWEIRTAGVGHVSGLKSEKDADLQCRLEVADTLCCSPQISDMKSEGCHSVLLLFFLISHLAEVDCSIPLQHCMLFTTLFPVCLFTAVVSVSLKSSFSPLRHILWGQLPRVCEHMHPCTCTPVVTKIFSDVSLKSTQNVFTHIAFKQM